MAAYIGSVASLFATAGITKAWSEKYEKRYNTHFMEKQDEEDATPEEG